MKTIILGTILASTAAAVQPAFAQNPPTTPAATTQRTMDDIMAEFERLNENVRSLVRSPDELLDPVRREEIGAKAVPQLKQLLALADELSGLGATAQQFAPELRRGVDSVLAVFNEPESVARLKALSANADPTVAVQAQCSLKFSEWIRSNKDAAKQTSLLDEVETLASQHPNDDNIAMALVQMSEAGPASPEIRERARSIATTKLKGELAERLKQQMADDAKLADLKGKPLTVSGVTHTGEKFSTDAWKGKVVLVDFAVSNWPPSRVQTEQLQKVYAEFHGKGLEIVTVSCDESLDDLTKFLSANPAITWPHLFDAQSPGWHSIAKSLSVTDPSTAILIDKTGNVRSIDAREKLEELIARAVAE